MWNLKYDTNELIYKTETHRHRKQTYGYQRGKMAGTDKLKTRVTECMVLVAELCMTLYDPMDCSPPGFSVHGILQARILEWVAISFSRGSSQSRDRTQISCTVGRFFTIWATTYTYKGLQCSRKNYIQYFVINLHDKTIWKGYLYINMYEYIYTHTDIYESFSCIPINCNQLYSN